MKKEAIEREISRLELYEKHGETYTNDKGSYGWRNPIRKDTGRILQSLMLAANPNRILEIGTAHGLSALYFILGVNNQCVMDTIEFDQSVATQTQNLMKELDVKVKVICGEAMGVLNSLNEPYDAIFFDAQKSHYGQQLELILSKGLLRKNGLIIADNVLDRYEECKDFYRKLDEYKIEYTVIETECGLLVAKY